MFFRRPSEFRATYEICTVKLELRLISMAVLSSTLAFVPTAWAAGDANKLTCKTTAECAAQTAKSGLTTTGGLGLFTSAQDKAEDRFFWLSRMNKASIVMLAEEGIVSRPIAQKIASGVDFSIKQAEAPNGRRPQDVIQIEKIIAEVAGPDASRIHAGRSRQDMYAAFYFGMMRTQVLDTTTEMNAMRERILKLAERHVDTVVPAYTNGVQAQPITYGHYLLAFADSFDRDAQRVREAYQRLNRSPMGTAVLANSAWPLNRARLAELIGFDGMVVNSYDSAQVAAIDMPVELANITASSALRVSAMIGDIHTQYHQTQPWILLGSGSTYTSSAMPQKRNPGLLMRVREASSDVAGKASLVMFRAHNTTPGMMDPRLAWQQNGLFVSATDMYRKMNQVLDALEINRERALEETQADWITSMELADTLQRDHDVPFRVGHGFASGIVTYARSQQLKPADFPFAKAVELYAEAARKYELKDTKLPLDEAAFRNALSVEHMVRTRTGVGGPQPAEVRRMLAQAKQTLASDQAWLAEQKQKIVRADQRLDAEFRKLLPASK